MKLKIKAITNQNVCVGAFMYPPYSDIEVELDTKQIPTYAKSFDSWEIIDPVVMTIDENKVETTLETNNDEKQYKQNKTKSYRENTTKINIQ